VGKEDNSVVISEKLAEDPNFIAYLQAQASGEFDKMEAGTFVAYHGGRLVGTGMDRDKLFQKLHEKGIEGFFFHQVGVPEQVVHLRSPHVARRTSRRNVLVPGRGAGN